MGSSTRYDILRPVLLAASAACTLFLVGWVLWLMRFGLDFTDESFYLVWIAKPFSYDISLSQFGFLYHPLYRLVDGYVVALRQVNFLLTYLLGVALSHAFLRGLFPSLQRIDHIIIAAALAISLLAFVRLWLPSPSYNWLALQGLMVTAIGLIKATKKNDPQSNIGWVLIAIGGWLAFMAKPTSGGALAVGVAIYIIAAGKFDWRLALRSIVTALLLLLVTAFIIDGSIEDFIARYRSNMEILSLLGSGHSRVLRFDGFTFLATDQKILVGGIALIAGAALLSQSRHAWLRTASAALQLAAAAAAIAVALGHRFAVLVPTNDYHLLLWMVPLAALVVALLRSRGKAVQILSRPHWALFGILLLLPYMFVFGTGNNYFWMGGLAAIFWVLAGFVFLVPLATSSTLVRLLLPFGFAVQFFATTIVIMGIQSPYYQTQLITLHDTPAKIGSGELLLSKEFGDYINNFTKKAFRAGFAEGTPVLDLTGHSPGVIYAMGGHNAAQPWITGNFPIYNGGGDRVAEWLFRHTDCGELASAWLLTEPKGPIAISPEILGAFGARLADYKVAVKHHTVPGLSGFPDVQEQRLLKPVRAHHKAVKACEAARAQ